MKIRKSKNALKRLQARQADWKATVAEMERNGKPSGGYRKPGSMKK